MALKKLKKPQKQGLKLKKTPSLRQVLMFVGALKLPAN